jgi:hypothetical protein
MGGFMEKQSKSQRGRGTTLFFRVFHIVIKELKYFLIEVHPS